MKRLISANPSEILQMNAEELKQSILASEGRVVLSENVVTRETFVGDITNSEIARAFGADMILLNCVDVFEPKIYALDSSGDDVIHRLHQLVACPIGVNLEPIDPSAKMLEETQEIVAGRVASVETLKRIEELGFDFVCLTGNPGTGVSNREIIKAVQTAKENFSGLIIAGKMHGAGVNEPVAELSVAEQLLEAGADVILVPAFHDQELREVVDLVHSKGGLVLSAIGTSQETSDTDTIKEIALRNKICGVDIQHIGDAGYGGLATVDNIYALSKAIRGVRHTVSRLARSVNR
ncbi:PEP phosphonomutase-like protein [Streptococcus pneumoniae]|nr:PEP phosphonomutase-like protein [Streptococcus pneumoniae]